MRELVLGSILPRWVVGGTFPASAHNCSRHGQEPSQHSSNKAEHSPWQGYGPSFFSIGLLLPFGSLLDSPQYSLGHPPFLKWWSTSCSFWSSPHILFFYSLLFTLILRQGGLFTVPCPFLAPNLLSSSVLATRFSFPESSRRLPARSYSRGLFSSLAISSFSLILLTTL